MKSSFPKPDKCHSKNNGLAMSIPKYIDYVLEESFQHLYTCVYMCIFIKSSFPKHNLQTWHWHCKLDFWIGADG